MMTSSYGSAFRFTGPFVRGIHRTPWASGAVFWSFDVGLNKLLNKQSSGWRFDTRATTVTWLRCNDNKTYHCVNNEHHVWQYCISLHVTSNFYINKKNMNLRIALENERVPIRDIYSHTAVCSTTDYNIPMNNMQLFATEENVHTS